MKKIVLAMCFAYTFMGHSQGLLNNLQACYPLDCYVGTVITNGAATGAPLNGIAYGNVTCVPDRNSNANSAVKFGGTPADYIELPNNPLIKPTTEITVSGWYNITANVHQDLVFAKNTCSSNFNGYNLIYNSGSFLIVKKPGITPGCGSGTSASSAAGLGWHFVVFYINNSVISIQVDNNATVSTAHSVAFDYDPSTGVILGGTNGSTNHPFEGEMDNVRFWDRQLTAGEIADLYNNDPACASLGSGGSGTTTVGCCLGNDCSQSKNPLSGNYEIPLNTHDFNFSGDGQTTDKVNIGIPCGNSLLGKLNVTTAFESDPSGNGDSYSIYSTNTNGLHGAINTGVFGSAISTRGSASSRGLWGFAENEMDARGVFGQGGNSFNSYGGYFESLSPQSGNSYGIYATAQNGSMSNWAGWFDGDVMVNGTAFYPGPTPIVSDRKFKREIQTIENASSLITKLKPSNYFLNTDNEYGLNFDSKKQFGFISQEVEEILPDLIIEGKKPATYDKEHNEKTKAVEYKALNYIGFIALLTKGFQEQQVLINTQSEAINQQQQQINELKELVHSLARNAAGQQKTALNTTNVELSDKNSVVLNQNVPNPFAESTVINYNIPSDFEKAQILFTSNEGRVIKTIDITSKGAGTLTVFANDLSNGVYSYTLVVDGKTIESKKMIKH